MLSIYNYKTENVPMVPAELKPHLEQCVCVELSAAEIKVIEEVYKYFSDYLKENPPTISSAGVIIFTSDGEVTFKLWRTSPALTLRLVVLQLSSIRPQRLKNLDIPVLWPAILEELFHCLYLIRDEIEVKKYVLEVIQQRYPEATFELLYQMDTDQLGRPVPALICERY